MRYAIAALNTAGPGWTVLDYFRSSRKPSELTDAELDALIEDACREGHWNLEAVFVAPVTDEFEAGVTRRPDGYPQPQRRHA
jgi:hypothetical protein